MSDERKFNIHYVNAGGYEASHTVSGEASIKREAGKLMSLDPRVRRCLAPFLNNASVGEAIVVEAFTGIETWTRVE